VTFAVSGTADAKARLLLAYFFLARQEKYPAVSAEPCVNPAPHRLMIQNCFAAPRRDSALPLPAAIG